MCVCVIRKSYSEKSVSNQSIQFTVTTSGKLIYSPPRPHRIKGLWIFVWPKAICPSRPTGTLFHIVEISSKSESWYHKGTRTTSTNIYLVITSSIITQMGAKWPAPVLFTLFVVRKQTKPPRRFPRDLQCVVSERWDPPLQLPGQSATVCVD